MKASVGFRIRNKPIAFFIKLTAISKIFSCLLSEVIFVHKIVTRIVRRIYVPTDFDTKEKALSVAKAAEKGLK